MGDPTAGKGGTFYVPFPVLGLASDGRQIFLTAGGGGSTSNKEVPNVVHALRYIEESGKLNTVAVLNTDKVLVVSLTYCPAADLWLASAKAGCKLLQLDLANNTLKELCGEWITEESGKEPEQNIARFSADATHIVTGGTDGLVKVWKAQKAPAPPQLKRVCGKRAKEILDADFSPDGSLVAACDGGGDCRLWELEKEGPEDGLVISYSSPGVKGKVFIKLVRFVASEGGTVLALGANGARGPALVGLYSTEGRKLKEVMVDKQPIKSMDVDRSQSRLLIGLMSGAKTILTCPGLSRIQKTQELHSLPAQSVAFLADGVVAVSGSGDRDVHLLRLRAGFGPSLTYLFVVFLVLLVGAAMLFRIADKGAQLGQGRLDL